MDQNLRAIAKATFWDLAEDRGTYTIGFSVES